MKNKILLICFCLLQGFFLQHSANAQCTPGSCGAGLNCVSVVVNSDSYSDVDPTDYTITVNGTQVASATSITPTSTAGIVLWSGCLVNGDVVSITLNDGFGDGLDGDGTGNNVFFIQEGVNIGAYDFGSSSDTYTYTVAALPPPPINDDPCNATFLTVNSGPCTPNNPDSWVGATPTTGIPDPGCGNFSSTTPDVWYAAVVPASGILAISTAAGSTTNGAMAAYTSTDCANLTLLACNDDASFSNLMPVLNLIGLTPGQTIYIRFWDYNGSNIGGIGGICVSDASIYPINDSICYALDVTGTGGFSGYNGNATPDNATVSNALDAAGLTWSYDNTLWYHFSASSLGTPNGTITVASDGNCGTDELQAALMVNTGTCDNPVFTLIASQPTTCADPIALSYSGLSANSDYYLVVDGCGGAICNFNVSGLILPTNALDFNGFYQNSNNKLFWTYDNNTITTRYEIEKSTDGQHFYQIGSLTANHTTTSAVAYHFNDANPFTGNNFYRLKIYTNTGAFRYSDIINIQRKENQNSIEFISLQPNPFRDNTRIRLYCKAVTIAEISITDGLGKVMVNSTRSLVQGDNKLDFDLDNLCKGLYFVHIKDANTGVVIERKIVKQ